MVIDYIIHGSHTSGYSFYTVFRFWGPKNMDFDGRVRSLMDMHAEIVKWEVAERRVRLFKSLLYRGSGHWPAEVRFIFYEDGKDDPEK